MSSTGDPAHLAFACHIGLTAPRLRPDSEVEHADGRMMNLQGLLALFEATGDQTYFDAVISDQRVIADHFMWPSGGIPEMLPDNLRDEACQTANWARLNLSLWRLTGDTASLDLAERTWLNHLYFDQHPNGGFCWGRTLREGGALCQRKSENGDPFEMWYCCSETGPRALLDLGRHAVASVDGQPVINLWAGGTYRLPGCRVEIARDVTPGERLEAVVESDLPVSTSLRLPARSEVVRLTVNGADTDVRRVGGRLLLPPHPRTRVAIDVRPLRAQETHEYPRFVTPGGDANNPDALWNPAEVVNYTGRHTARFAGPWLLQADVEEDAWFEPNRGYRQLIES